MAWLAFKPVVTLVATRESTTLLLEFLHRNSGECRSLMMLGSVMVDFVNRLYRVNNVRLNRFCRQLLDR